MRYFTPELLERVASPDDDMADAAQAEWERAITRCKRRWQKIKGAFPRSVQRFEEQSICLHDAQVLSMACKEKTLVLVLRLPSPAGELALLTFTLDGDPVIVNDTVRGQGDGRVVNWLYEEWDLDRHRRYLFEVLLSNGWLVRLRFRDFQFMVLPQVLAAINGETKSPTPRSQALAV